MQEIWIVQTHENRYEILDIFDNKDSAYECAENCKEWIYAVYPMKLKSEYIKPKAIK
jgi:hypothetical protein